MCTHTNGARYKLWNDDTYELNCASQTPMISEAQCRCKERGSDRTDPSFSNGGDIDINGADVVLGQCYFHAGGGEIPPGSVAGYPCVGNGCTYDPAADLARMPPCAFCNGDKGARFTRSSDPGVYEDRPPDETAHSWGMSPGEHCAYVPGPPGSPGQCRVDKTAQGNERLSGYHGEVLPCVGSHGTVDYRGDPERQTAAGLCDPTAYAPAGGGH
jgi:hypothetical protein